MKRLISLVLLAPAFVSVAIAQDYTVTFLGTLGGPNSLTNGINDAGYVTGYSQTPIGASDAFLWKGGTMTDLGPGQAFAANASGEAVGLGNGGAVLFQNGLTKAIDGAGSWAFGINNAGTIVGFKVIGGSAHPFIYNNGTLAALGIVGSAQAINNRGQVVGYVVYPNGDSRAFLYQHGAIADLGLPVNGSFAETLGTDISENGKFIVGWADTTASPVTTNIAFLDTKGKMIALGTLGGATSVANGVNNSGEVVGAAMISNSPFDDAFLYRDGKMIDLNSLISPSLGIRLDNATGINDQGWIVATATNEATGHSEAVLLKPNGRGVPEPPTLALLAFGIAALAMAQGTRSRPVGR